MPGVLRHSDIARYVAVCDLDTVRIADGKEMIESYYARKFQKDNYANIKTFGDYREMLADKGIDAVCISTPDHWHAQPAIEAALAGKDIYVQKPASLTIHEGRQMADTIQNTDRILQLGSQQRSEPQFRLACELVRKRPHRQDQGNLHRPARRSGGTRGAGDAGPLEPELRDVAGLDAAGLLHREAGASPDQDMKTRYDRPGWLRCEQFGAGMITGWGAHHLDIAQWGMGLEHSGPVAVEATAEFPRKGLWDVHGSFHVTARYPNGAIMYVGTSIRTESSSSARTAGSGSRAARTRPGDQRRASPRQPVAGRERSEDPRSGSRTATSACTSARRTTIIWTG